MFLFFLIGVDRVDDEHSVCVDSDCGTECNSSAIV